MLTVRKETMPIFSVLSLLAVCVLACLTSLLNIPMHCNQERKRSSQPSGKACAQGHIRRGLNMSTAPDVSTLAPSPPVHLPSSEERRLDGTMSLSIMSTTNTCHCPAKNTQEAISDQVAMRITAYYVHAFFAFT